MEKATPAGSVFIGGFLLPFSLSNADAFYRITFYGTKWTGNKMQMARFLFQQALR